MNPFDRITSQVISAAEKALDSILSHPLYPRCEEILDQSATDTQCKAMAIDYCVHCELPLCAHGFAESACTAQGSLGRHLPMKKSIRSAIAEVATEKRIAG